MEIVAGADKALDFAAVMKLVNSDPVVNAGAGKAGKKIIPLLVKQNMAATTAQCDAGAPAGEESFDEMEFLAPLKDLISKKVGVTVEM